MPTDRKELLASVDLAELVTSYGVKLKKQGAELVGICPFHAEKTPSFNVNPRRGVYQCRGCGVGGSAIDFVIEAEGWGGLPEKQAVAKAFEVLSKGTTGGALTPLAPPDPKAVWVPLPVVPPSAPPPFTSHYELGLPAAKWAYQNEAGGVIGYVYRFELADGKKDLRPAVYAERESDGARAWKWLSFGKPRPLLGLPELAARPNAPVCVVEGEKTMDAARRLLPGSVVVTWPGGGKAIHYADFTPLKGRKVLIWPDADGPGHGSAFGWLDKGGELRRGVAQFAAEAGAAGLRAVLVPEGLAEGWDAADLEAEGATPESARAWLSQHTGEVPAPLPYTAPPRSVRLGAKMNQPDAEPRLHPPLPAAPREMNEPFTCLGFSRDTRGQGLFHFYSAKAEQALTFSPGGLTKNALIQLADLHYWERIYKATGASKTWEPAAVQSLMNACYEFGPYDPEKIRGVGAWLDNGRVVVHAGRHLVAGGAEYTLTNFPTEYIYEAARSFGFRVAEPLESEQSKRFYELVNLMNWERPAYAILFLGWCIVAPMSGALNWRPHIWLTGGAGSGKTTALKVLSRLLGPIALRVQGTTTEPGIRHALNSAARPVLFDEADSDSKNDTDRLQAVLALVRAASSYDAGSVAKGQSGGGGGVEFQIRSCFAFAGITPKIANAADRSRVTVLSLISRNGETGKASTERWAKMQALMAEILTPERCERLHARTLALLPELLANAEVFARAAGLVLGEQRAGDQLGVMLAGAYSLQYTDRITAEKAEAWIRKHDWSEIRNEERDEDKLLSFILQQVVTVESNAATRYEKNVGDLVLLAADGAKAGEVLTTQNATEKLKTLGLKVKDERLYIANQSNWLSRILYNTAWATNHNKVLSRMPGALADSNKTVHFSSALKQKAVSVPLTLLRESV